MAEYIDREDLAKHLDILYNRLCGKSPHFYCGFLTAVDLVKNFSDADVEPVLHSEWEEVDWREYDENSCEVICYPKDGIACTHCRYVFKKSALWRKNFCPNCGAKMDGGGEDG